MFGWLRDLFAPSSNIKLTFEVLEKENCRTPDGVPVTGWLWVISIRTPIPKLSSRVQKELYEQVGDYLEKLDVTRDVSIHMEWAGGKPYLRCSRPFSTKESAEIALAAVRRKAGKVMVEFSNKYVLEDFI